jgi:hypothetical protein
VHEFRLAQLKLPPLRLPKSVRMLLRPKMHPTMKVTTSAFRKFFNELVISLSQVIINKSLVVAHLCISMDSWLTSFGQTGTGLLDRLREYVIFFFLTLANRN